MSERLDLLLGLFFCLIILGYSEDMLKKVLIFSLVGSIGLLAALMQTTTPATTGPIGVLMVFVLLYVAALSSLTFLIYKGSQLLVRLSRSVTVKRPLSAFSLTRAYYFSSVLALAPVMIIGMQSVGEVGLYDLVLVGAFVFIACLYIAKRTV